MHTTSSLESSKSTVMEHWNLVAESWRKIEQLRTNGKVVIDGTSLDVPSIVAVARYDSSLVYKHN